MVAKETARLTGMIQSVSKSTGEQATGAADITANVESIRRQSDQVAKAMTEQSRAGRDIAAAAHNVARQIGMINRANSEHSLGMQGTLNALHELQRLHSENRENARQTARASSELLESSRGLGVALNGSHRNSKNGKRKG